MKFRKLIYVLFTTIALIFTACDNSISDFLNKWTNFTPPENAKNDIQEVDVEEKSEKDYSYIVLLNPENYNENVLLRYNKIYVSKEAETAAKGCFCTYLPDDTGVTQVLYSTNISCNDEIDEEGFFTVADSSITFKVADENVDTVRKYGLVFKYKGLSVNKVYLVEEGSSGDNGGGNSGTTQSTHMTLSAREDGIGIIVSVPDLYVQDSFMVIDKATGTGFSIEGEYINSEKSVEFIFPFCNTNQQIVFELHGNVKDNEKASETRWLYEEATVTANGGVGPLNYSNFDTIKLFYYEDNDNGRYLRTENFTLDNISSLFMNCYGMYQTTDLYDEFALISGYEDWSNGTFWLNGASNSFFNINESDTNLTYMLLSERPIDILDSVGWFINYKASYINEQLSKLKKLFFTFKVRFRIPEYNNQFIDFEDHRCYAGSFVTKDIQSDVYSYTPASLANEDDYKGRAGENIKWQINNGVLTFTGYDNIWGYDYAYQAPWNEYFYSSVEFDDGITLIGRHCFPYNENLESVKIPASVEVIESFAFNGCTSLTELEFESDSNCRYVGDHAFENTGLSSIMLPEYLQTIENYAFFDTRISSVTIPASVESIGENAFNEGTSLNVNWTKSNAGSHHIENYEKYTINYKNEGGNVSDSISWEFVNRTLYIKGQGAMSDYDATWDDSAPWVFKPYDTVVIDDGITYIGSYAFRDSIITSITIPASVETIGSSAFSNSTLTEVIFEENSKCEQIGNYAFSETGITSVTIPASVKTIGDYAFNYCSSLTTLEFEKGSNCEQIGERAFCDTGITSVTIPASVKTIGDYAFCNTGITSVTIPASVKTIGSSAFSNSTLTEVIFEENSNCEQIGETAFYRTGITSVTIPASVKTIGDGAFNCCFSLTTLEFEEGSNCEQIGVGAFEFAGITSVTIPASVKTIGDYAFYNTGIYSVTIPSSVTTIGSSAFNSSCLLYVDWSMKDVLVNSTSAYIKYINIKGELSDSVSWKIEDDVLYIEGEGAMPDFNSSDNDTAPWRNMSETYSSVVVKDGITAVGNYAFYSMEGITSVTIPASVKTIGDSAFYDTGITSVTIPASVEFIGENAFRYSTEVYVDWYESESDEHNVGLSNVIYRVNDVFTFSDDGVLTIDCDVNKNFLSENNITPTSVKKLVIGKNVSVIGEETFKNCSKLKEITCSDSECSLKEVRNCAFYLTDSLEKVDLSACSKLTVIGAGAFYETRSLTEVYLPSSVEEILANAFQNCVNLETLNLNACTNLKLIDDRAFENCSSLKSVTFHGNITKVGEYAFSGCTSLETADLTECVNLETLGCSVFNGCSKLKAADLSNCTKITYIDAGMFYNCTSLASVALPSTVTSLDNSSVFQNCAFTEVDLSNCSSLTALSGAFCDCSKLTRIVLPESITSFANNEFSGCTNLAEVDLSRCTNLSYIGEYSFEGTAINSIDLSNTAVTKISHGTFSQCSKLTTVTLPEDIAEIGSYAFVSCRALRTINLNNCVSINTIGSSAFEGTAITSIDLGGYTKLNTINSSAFSNCSSLAEVVLPAKLSSIDKCVFSNCSALTSVDLSVCSRLETLGESVFSYCTSLTEITLPSGIISIHDHAFQNCSALTSVNLSGCTSLETIGNYAFESCYALTPVDLSGCTSLTTIGYAAFNICHVLDYVILPPSVKSIDYGAFNYTDEIKWNCTKSEYDDTHPEQLNFSNKFSFSDTQKITINYYSNNNYFNYSDGSYNDNFSYSIEYWSTNSTEINKLPWTNSSNYKQFLGWYKEPEFKNKVSDMEELFSGEETIVNLYALVGEIYEVEPADYSIYIISEFTDTCKMKVYILPIEDGITENCNVYYGNTENGLSDYCKPDVKMGFLVGDTLTVSENTMVYSETDIRKISNFDLSLFTYENGNVEFTAMVFVPSESGSTGKFAFNIRQSQ